jgi:hypothetical protein
VRTVSKDDTLAFAMPARPASVGSSGPMIDLAFKEGWRRPSIVRQSYPA